MSDETKDLDDRTRAEIAELVAGLPPVDWEWVRAWGRLSFSQRIISGMQAQEFAMASLRATFRNRFPELSSSEINMKVLAYLTPVRMPNKNEG